MLPRPLGHPDGPRRVVAGPDYNRWRIAAIPSPFIVVSSTPNMEKLKQSLLDAPIIEKNGYHYFVHPISDGIPVLEPGLLREIVIQIIRKAELEDVDKIVTPAAMGIHISTAVSLMTDIPLVVIRKREYGLDGEVSLQQVTGYSESEMYVNDVNEGERV